MLIILNHCGSARSELESSQRKQSTGGSFNWNHQVNLSYYLFSFRDLRTTSERIALSSVTGSNTHNGRKACRRFTGIFSSLNILIRLTFALLPRPSLLRICSQGSFHLRASAGRRPPQHHSVAEVRRDGDEEPPGEPRPQHLGQSHHHPPTSQPVLVWLSFITCW